MIETQTISSSTPIGTPVVVVRDNGNAAWTRTRSEPYVIHNRDLVVFVEGIPGYYLAERCFVVPLSSQSLSDDSTQPGAFHATGAPNAT